MLQPVGSFSKGVALRQPGTPPSSLDYINSEGGTLGARDCVRNTAACRVWLDVEGKIAHHEFLIGLLLGEPCKIAGWDQFQFPPRHQIVA